MHRLVCRFSICILVTVFFVPAAGAQLSSQYADWDKGPEGYLFTKKEKKEWKKIKTDAEAEAWIELFWARRNPSPETSFNGFKAEFDAIVEFCDGEFGYGKRRGALSDRARVLLLMGKPAGRQVNGPAQTGPIRAGSADDADTPLGASEIWIYDPSALPKGFKVKGAELVFQFYEEKLGSNGFILDRSARTAFQGLSALAEAPDVYFLHPNMKEVPTPVSFAGARAASAESQAWLDQEAPFNDANRVVSELGVTDAVSRPLWVHIELPSDAPDLTLLAGRVKTVDGEIISTFEVDAEPLEGQYGKAYHLSFPLEAGSFTVDVVGAAEGSPQITTSVIAEVTPVPSEGAWMSPLWLGISVNPDEEALHGDPFSFAGWHVVPLSGSELTREAEIVYFGFVIRPHLTEDGKVDLEVKLQVNIDDEPAGSPLSAPLTAMQMLPDVWMYGNSIALERLPETGSYGFNFKVTETGSEIAAERGILLEIIE